MSYLMPTEEGNAICFMLVHSAIDAFTKKKMKQEEIQDLLQNMFTHISKDFPEVNNQETRLMMIHEIDSALKKEGYKFYLDFHLKIIPSIYPI